MSECAKEPNIGNVDADQPTKSDPGDPATPIPNPDSEGLGCWGDNRFVVGYVDEVNGPGSVEVAGFAATRHELMQLVKYWSDLAIDLQFSWFIDQSVGSSETRLEPFAWRRISRIADVLGNDLVSAAVQQAYEEYGRGCDPRAWHVFRNGTPEEREAFLQESGSTPSDSISQSTTEVIADKPQDDKEK
jgi:hypothetical protein